LEPYLPQELHPVTIFSNPSNMDFASFVDFTERAEYELAVAASLNDFFARSIFDDFDRAFSTGKRKARACGSKRKKSKTFGGSSGSSSSGSSSSGSSSSVPYVERSGARETGLCTSRQKGRVLHGDDEDKYQSKQRGDNNE